MAEIYDAPKMTFKSWVANFWYYYKWFFLLGVVVVIFLSICFAQYASKSDSDVAILVVGSQSVSTDQSEKMIRSAETFVPDLNGDGSVSVHLNAITLHSDLSLLDQLEREQAREDYKQYSDEILGGDACILILDEYYYQALAENGNLVNLYGVFEKMPEAAFDYYGLRLGETPLYKLDGFSSLSPDMVLCLKFTSPVSQKEEIEKIEEDVNNIDVFRSFYEGKWVGEEN